MLTLNPVPAPILFNPLKHHLAFIREFITEKIESGDQLTVKELKHVGGSVMDVYSGNITPWEICEEILCFLKIKKLSKKALFRRWAGTEPREFKTIFLSDG